MPDSERPTAELPPRRRLASDGLVASEPGSAGSADVGGLELAAWVKDDRWVARGIVAVVVVVVVAIASPWLVLLLLLLLPLLLLQQQLLLVEQQQQQRREDRPVQRGYLFEDEAAGVQCKCQCKCSCKGREEKREKR